MVSVADRLIELTRRGQAWAQQRPMLVDAMVALVAGVVSVADYYGARTLGRRDPDTLGLILVVAAAVMLLWRRRAPLSSLTFAVAIMVTVYLREYGTFVSAVGLASMYSAVAHGRLDAGRGW